MDEHLHVTIDADSKVAQAASRGDLAALTTLLGGDETEYDCHRFVNGFSALHTAASHGHSEIVRLQTHYASEGGYERPHPMGNVNHPTMGFRNAWSEGAASAVGRFALDTGFLPERQ